MTADSFFTIGIGVLAAIGLGGFLVGAVVARTGRSRRIFSIGCIALAAAGLMQIAGVMIGVTGPTNIFGGLMMLLLGTGASLPPVASAPRRTQA